ncbi:MAG TPA: spermidine/putrescine ABC transporter substrate-binding protein [Nanoarchaeota archaeon]|nr:spermidine/putrescine ABC transporter substrate-binding protein [Nanoarchaeota archaeon]HIH63544.1 spermidine/putrescine ABC transporter substrate-binding protein [Nanoarchaeota archaeon]HIJ09472.1 spermidine/putrescine ABC transporter substrate-binding protein [Nanoarchaeota archaeon]
MKKGLFCLGIIILIVGILFLVFFGLKKINSIDTVKEINFYYWWDYIGEEIIKDFEKESGIKVNNYIFETEHEMLQEMRLNSQTYDVVGTIETVMSDMIDEGLLLPINKTNIPNLRIIDERCFINGSEKFIDYAIPHAWGTTGIIINTKYIPEDTDSWGVLWDPKYSGKIALLNNIDDLLVMASKYLGFSLIPQNKEEFNEVRKALLEQKSLVSVYEEDLLMVDDLVSEKIWAAQIYDGTAREAIALNNNLKYFVPKEGTLKWVDYLTISSKTKNKADAERFINYLLTPEVDAKITNYSLYSSCNFESRPLMNNIILDSEISLEDFSKIQSIYEVEEFDGIKDLKSDLLNELIE